MKKALALILCAVMLLVSIPVMSFAAEETVHENETLIIENGETYTVKSGDTLYVANDGAIIVEEGGKLVVNGDIITYSGSEIYIQGTLVGARNISGSGDVRVQIRFDKLSDYGVEKGEITLSYAVASTITAPKETAYATLDPTTTTAIDVPLYSYLFVKTEVCKEEEAELGRDKYDDSLYHIYMNSTEIEHADGSKYVQITTGANITYDKWSLNPVEYLSTFTVTLPSGKEGYTVYTKDGETGDIAVKYGTPISFYVELDEDYNKSVYEVYVYHGKGFTSLDPESLLEGVEPAVPDEYGYYHVDAVEGPLTVYVLGVMSNETISMLGDVLAMVKNIFEMFSSLLAEFFAMLGLGTATPAVA